MECQFLFSPSLIPQQLGNSAGRPHGSLSERKGTATGDSREGHKVSAEQEEQRRGRRRDGGSEPAEDGQESRAGVRARAARSG